MNTIQKLPDILKQEWNNRKGAVVFTTVSGDAIPNSIFVTCVSLYEENKILVANNYFDKTIANIMRGSHGSILFITNDDKAYQFKGSIEYTDKGAVFEHMKKWNPEQHPGHGVAIVNIEEVYSGAKKII